MGKTLVVVESPAKAKTINKYLGTGYEVMASKGHVRDLPKKLGIDVENDFQETFEVIESKAKVLTELKAAAKKSEDYFAAESKKLDDNLVEAYKKANVKVVTMTPEQADKWRKVAAETSYKTFSEKAPGGKELIEKALSVK